MQRILATRITHIVLILPFPATSRSDEMSNVDSARETVLIAKLEAGGVAGVTMDNGGVSIHWANTEEQIKIAAQFERLSYLNAARSEGAPLLHGPEMRHLRGHKNLRRLVISNMPISGAHYDVFPTLPKLQMLACTLVEGVKEGMTHIGKCKGLRELYMEYSAIPDESLDLLRGLENLEELRLSHNPISSGMHVVRHMKNLRKLSLEDTRIDDDVLKTIAELPKLEELVVGGAKISDAGLEHLVRCTSLKFLAVQSQRITSNGLTKLTALTWLENLYFRRTKPDAALFKALGQMQHLTSLLCNGTGIPAKDRNNLLRMLPDCDVSWIDDSEPIPEDIRLLLGDPPPPMNE